jgi:hypothetical protein
VQLKFNHIAAKLGLQLAARALGNNFATVNDGDFVS